MSGFSDRDRQATSAASSYSDAAWYGWEIQEFINQTEEFKAAVAISSTWGWVDALEATMMDSEDGSGRKSHPPGCE